MLIEAGRLIVRATSWFLRSRRLAEPMERDDRAVPARRRGDPRRAPAPRRRAGALAARHPRGALDAGRRAARDRRARGGARHAVRCARHRRGGRRRSGRCRAVGRGLLRRSRRSSASRGCATASARSPATATGRRSRRPRCATISPACSARWPPNVARRHMRAPTRTTGGARRPLGRGEPRRAGARLAHPRRAARRAAPRIWRCCRWACGSSGTSREGGAGRRPESLGPGARHLPAGGGRVRAAAEDEAPLRLDFARLGGAAPRALALARPERRAARPAAAQPGRNTPD